MPSLRCRRLLALIATSCAFVSGPASARCPVDQLLEVGLRADLFTGYIPTFQSGDTLPKEGVFAVALQPTNGVAYFLRPAGGTAVGYGGLVTLEDLATGRYGIVLSQDARLEAVQQRPFRPVPVTQRAQERDCSVVEINVEGGPLTLQISGASSSAIMVAMIRIRD
jgi:hypothetical protein